MKDFSIRRSAAWTLVLLAALGGFSAVVAQAMELPDAPGKELLLDSCIDCHGADTIAKTRRSPDEWAALVERMIEYGAAVSSEEKAVVVKYLSTSLGTTAVSAPASTPPASSPEQPPAGSSPTAPATNSAADPKASKR